MGSKPIQPGGTPGLPANLFEKRALMAEAKRYLRKRQSLMAMVTKIKLWPSRHGILHGVKSIVNINSGFEITTHCGLVFKARNSANSRAARWLRGKQYTVACPVCRIPDWKIEKFGATVFSKRLGRTLVLEEKNLSVKKL